MPQKRYHIIIEGDVTCTVGPPIVYLPEDDLARHLHPPLANPEPLPSTSYRGPKKKSGKKSISSPTRGSSRKKK